MTIFKAIILGIIQGVAEFLPISSSAHLIVFPYLFGWEESSLAFDVALHFGTMMAVLVIFFKDWWNLFIGAIKDIKNKEKQSNEQMMKLVKTPQLPE
jgi:undecaprenyl-diphosphatase